MEALSSGFAMVEKRRRMSLVGRVKGLWFGWSWILSLRVIGRVKVLGEEEREDGFPRTTFSY